MSLTPDLYKTSFTKEMRTGFSNYARYVISDRAIPDARDGLKPVHRRILWAMNQLGLGPRSAFKKCARIVGETTGRYHPHAGGVYESLVRMGQHWSLRYPLVQPQGNFGSIDGFPPAAMRYTEARLTQISTELMEGISPKVVEFIDNFDGEEQEPTVLPVKIPHLLLNGSYGIAVGISSNIPPHNLHELLNACIAIIDQPTISTEDLIGHVTGPDFPTGGTIVGQNGIYNLYKTGRGSLRIRSKTHLETPETHKIKEHMIVIDEIPYLQNKASIIQAIATLIDENKLRGVKDVRDLSKGNIRIEIIIDSTYADELSVNTILGQLFKSTQLETLFHSRITAFVYGRPMTLNLKQTLCVFLDFREKTIKEIAKEELEKVNARLHILQGLIKASAHIDEIIELIRNSESRSDAQSRLMVKYELSEIQAKAVLDMTLARLARVEQLDLRREAEEKEKRKDELEKIIHHRPTLLLKMRDEFEALLKKYKFVKKTNILPVDDIFTGRERPILHDRNMLITSTLEGYLRAIDYDKFKTQGRGGKGVAGVTLGENDNLLDMVVVSNLEDLLLITNQGKIHLIPAFELPEVKNRTAKGSRIVRFLPVEGSVVKIVNIEYDNFIDKLVLVTVTKYGIIKRTTLDKYKNIRKTGIRCLNLKEGDEVIDAFISDGSSYIFMASKYGSACVFQEEKARLTGRVAQGVIGMKLRKADEVVSAFAVPKEELKDTSIFTVTEKGYGKRTPLEKYRITNRGAMGVKNMKITDKNGSIVTSMPIPIEAGDSTISLINSSGTLIKVAVATIRNMGRSTQGVRVMKMKGKARLLMATSIIDEGDDSLPVNIEEIDENAKESSVENIEEEKDIIEDEADFDDQVDNTPSNDEL